MCRCTGDPHCVSFDGRDLPFMGSCLYTMARDGCRNGVVKSPPTITVVVDFWRKGKDTDVSFVREAQTTIGDVVSESIR